MREITIPFRSKSYRQRGCPCSTGRAGHHPPFALSGSLHGLADMSITKSFKQLSMSFHNGEREMNGLPNGY